MNVELSAELELSDEAGAPFAISPDGRRLVVAMGQPPMLHIRGMNQLEFTVLSGTEEARNPFFSPDGRWIAFFTGQNLKKVSVTGGAPLTLCDVQRSRGGSWGADDFIVLATHTQVGLSRISAAGGELEPLTELDSESRERSHRWPQHLPGGRGVLFTRQARGENFNESLIELFDLETRQRTVLHRGGSQARYVPGGFLVFVRENTLFAARFDLDRLALDGAPVPVVEQISFDSSDGGSKFTVSPTGVLMYVEGEPFANWAGTISRIDRDGTETRLLTDSAAYHSSAVSPDGNFVATSIIQSSASGLRNIWILDLEREVMTRLTFTESTDWWPSWTPDGRYVTFSSDRNGDMNLYRKPADGSGDAERLTTNNDSGEWAGGSWSPDGSTLLFTQFKGSNNIAVLQSGVDGSVKSFLKTESNEQFPKFSPDGHWVAYQSSESGDREIYVRPYPGPGGKWQISRGGGTLPTWSRDGSELFFFGNDERTVYSVSIVVENGSLRAGRPAALFEIDRRSQGLFDVTLGGAFVMALRDPEESVTTSGAVVTFVLDWPIDLDERVP